MGSLYSFDEHSLFSGAPMDLANDERLKQLNEQIQKEHDPKKLAELTQELLKLIDEKREKPK